MSSVGNNAKKILSTKFFHKSISSLSCIPHLSACQDLIVTADVDHLPATATLTLTSLNPFQDRGREQKAFSPTPISLSPITFQDTVVSPENFVKTQNF